MKKRKVTKLLALALTAVMLAGCGNIAQEADGSGESKRTESSGAAAGGEQAESSKGEAPVEEEPVEIRFFYSYDPATETRSSKYLVEQMEKELNIKLIRDEVPGSAYEERLQQVMADGDYPDVILFDSHSHQVLISAIEDGICIPVNDLIADKENLQKYIDPITYDTAKVMNDDNIYLIPRCSVARVDGFAVREDWLENLNVELDEDYAISKEDFLELMRRMTQEDPDGNGKDDTYGYPYRAFGGMLYPVWQEASGCMGWQPSDGEYAYMDPVYEIGNQAYRDALEFGRELYKYAHPDSAVTQDVDALFAAGEVGIIPSFAGHVASKQQQVEAINPDARVTYISGIRGEDGILRGNIAFPGIWGGVAITSACEHPEKVAEMMDWLLSDQGWEYIIYGEPGYTYNKTADGQIEVIPETYKAEGKGWGASVARRQKDVNFFIDQSLGKEEREVLDKWLTVAVSCGTMSANRGKTPAEGISTELAEAENELAEVRTKIIMGQMDVSEYDKALEKWYESGGREYVEKMNALIAGMQ